MPLRNELMQLGAPANVATAMAANGVMESGGNHRAKEKGGHGFGIFQITDRARRALFRRTMGVDVEQATRQQQLRYALWELSHSERRGWQRAQANGQDSPNLAAGYARFVERPKEKDRDSAERAAIAEAMTINLQVQGLPKGAKVTATSRRGARPAISHAVAH